MEKQLSEFDQNPLESGQKAPEVREKSATSGSILIF